MIDRRAVRRALERAPGRRAAARAGLVLRRLRAHDWFWPAVLGVAVVAAMLGASALGAAHVPLAQMPDALVRAEHPAHELLWRVRLPRVACGAIVGAALAVAGALMQAVVRNPLADPGLLGITAGAGVGGMLAIVLAPTHPDAVPFTAFAGGLLAAIALIAVGWTGRASAGPLRILLGGVAVQAILLSVIALMTFLFADRAPAFVAFAIGSLAGLGWDDALLVLPPAVAGTVLALASTRALDLLLLDDDSAAGVGLAVRRTRLWSAALAALLAGAAVSVAGLVGFVGLVVPNWVRMLVGPEHRLVLPLCVLGGAALLVAADTAARTVAAPLELPVGALLALIGGPYFLVVLWRKVA